MIKHFYAGIDWKDCYKPKRHCARRYHCKETWDQGGLGRAQSKSNGDKGDSVTIHGMREYSGIKISANLHDLEFNETS